MTNTSVRIFSLLIAFAPLAGVYASDNSQDEAMAQEFGLSVAEYRQQMAQYREFSQAHEQTQPASSAQEQIRALKAYEIAHQERLLNDIYMRDAMASVSTPMGAALQGHALQVYSTSPNVTLQDIGQTFVDRVNQIALDQSQMADEGQQDPSNPGDGAGL